ncbi:MAG: cellulase family glycosylhydrolase [Eubacterium sp.]|nr:cellulase family glycosylhydrolase [Eubacterium sp.]
MKEMKRRNIARMLVVALFLGIFSWQPNVIKAESVKNFTSANNEVTITLTERCDNEYWYEYSLAVTNHSSQSIHDWSIELSVSDISKYSKCFGCQVSKENGKLVVKGQGNGKVVAPGTTYKVDGDFKLGFTGQVSFNEGNIAYEYGDQSNGGDDEGSVGYGNTYLDGYQCHYTLTGQTQDLAYKDTPYGKHGALHVDGLQIKDAGGKPFTLRGASTHGMHWDVGETFLNKTAFQNLRDEWGVNMVRLVNYVTQGGYTEGSKEKLDNHIQQGVSDLTDLGMYAIIDWHIHNEDPNTTKTKAIEFFDMYSKKYKDQSNIIYEICNEPTNTPWNQIRPYAVEVVNTIRANDPDAIIIVGTNTWSQDVDAVATDGGKIDDPNVMYTIHFYSGTHGDSLREKVRTALDAGTPVFCTEFGVCDASGNGGFDLEEADSWIDFFEEKGISYCCWSLSKKDESASMLSPKTSKINGFTNEDLGATGAWLINTYRGKNGEQPTASATPSASAGPGSSTEPQPSASATPSASAGPGSSTEPKPSASATPNASSQPGSSTEPTPSASATPSASSQPGSSTEPMPSASATPSVSSQPGSSTEPTPSASANTQMQLPESESLNEKAVSPSGKILIAKDAPDMAFCMSKIDGVEGVELCSYNKNTSQITIPDKVTIGSKKYPVTSIAAKAFAGNKKLTKVVIGKNIRKVGAKAFYQCKNLKKITIKSKKLTMKRVGQKAFAGIYKKVKVTLPKSGFSKTKKKQYKKILRGRGIGKKAIIR